MDNKCEKKFSNITKNMYDYLINEYKARPYEIDTYILNRGRHSDDLTHEEMITNLLEQMLDTEISDDDVQDVMKVCNLDDDSAYIEVRDAYNEGAFKALYDQSLNHIKTFDFSIHKKSNDNIILNNENIGIFLEKIKQRLDYDKRFGDSDMIQTIDFSDQQISDFSFLKTHDIYADYIKLDNNPIKDIKFLDEPQFINIVLSNELKEIEPKFNSCKKYMIENVTKELSDNIGYEHLKWLKSVSDKTDFINFINENKDCEYLFKKYS